MALGLLIVFTQGLLPFHPGSANAFSAASAARGRASPAGGVNAGYPQLANYNGYAAPGQTPFFAGYNLVIAQRGAPIGLLHAANPRAVTLLYERTLQADLCCMSDLYGMDVRAMPPRWWLLDAGSRLAASISRDQQWITVSDPRPFAPCQDVLVDGESMHVWAVQGRRLGVIRGYYSAAARHRAGASIAAHMSYRVDLSNCTLTGPGADLRPWSLNLSSRCPRWHGQTWVDYLAHRVAYLVRRDGWSGVFFDNLTDLPFSRSVDTNGDGRADGGIIRGVNVWEAGGRALLAETHRLLPHLPLLVNGDLRIVGLANGREMEGFPTIPGLALSAAIDSYLADAALGTPRTIVNPDTQGRPAPSQAVADLAVGVSLLGDGYAAYDRGWLDHGDPWWFDAYDRGYGAPLRLPVGPWTAQLVVAHPWQYAVGDKVLLNQEAAVVTGITPHAVLVERGMDGTVAVAHDAGTRVSTAWQRLQGHGYLGLPVGPARLVATEQWNGYALPLAQMPAPAGKGVGLHHPAVEQLGARSLIAIHSRLYYNADAAGVTLLPGAAGPVLRTLTFDARGPAGTQVWITAGATSVPIVLRGSWHRYVLPLAHADPITVGTGRVGGRVLLRRLALYGVQAFVWRRDFTHGLVLVNPTDRFQHLSLERPYRVLAEPGMPGSASGRLTCVVTIPHYRALILLNGPPAARCAPARPTAGRTAGTPVAGATAAAPPSVMTTADALHLRGGPSLTAPIVETLPLGTRLLVHGNAGDWVAVTAPDGAQGYVLQQYVSWAPTQ